MNSEELNGLNSIKQAVDRILFVSSKLSRGKRKEHDKHRDLFIQIINAVEYIKNNTLLTATDLHIDLTGYNEKFFDIIDSLIFLKYGKECAEVIQFYLWDRVNPDGSLNPLIDPQKNEIILQTPLDLWVLLNRVNPKLDK